MKLAIVGSRAFTNEQKVQKLIDGYCNFYGKANLIIVSGECPDGADAVAKRLALANDCHYVAFPPKHSRHNCYCIKPPEEYGKPYHVSNFFIRNAEIAEYCEHLAAFVVKGVKCNGTMDTYNKANKLGKKCLLFEE